MADIVLEDGTGESQTYEDVDTLEVDTPDGGTTTYVNESLIPEAYVHPSTHPASMITGLAHVAKGGEFADLRAKPFGDMPRLEECELSFPASEDGYPYVTIPGIWDVKPGDAYVITYDGNQYPCVCKSFADTEADGTLFDNILYLGNAGMLVNEFPDIEDTGEPFMFGFINNYSDHAAGVEGDTEASFIIHGAAETHTISIIPVESVRKLDAKYLPDGTATKEYVQEEISKIEVSGGATVTQTDILPEQTLDGFSANSDFGGAYTVNGNFPESELTTDLMDAFTITQSETYIVVWDGKEYEVTAEDASALDEGALVLGNGVAFGLSGNDEPFVIGWSIYGATFASLNETVTSHTIRIYQRVEAGSSLIPEFDLTAMGLPALTLDGTEVSVESDTTELRTALEKNLVKLSFTANTGTEQTVSGIVNAMCMGGSYQCGFLGYLGCPTMLNFEISETAITGKVLMWTT